MKSKIGSFFGTLLIPLIYIGAMIVISFIGSFIAGIILALTNPSVITNPETLAMPYNMLMVISSIGMIAGLGFVFLLVNKKYKIKFFEKNPINFKLLLLSIIIGLTVSTVIGHLPTMLFPNGKPAENPVTNDFSFMTIIVAVILAPIIEELIFRKYFMDAARKRGLSSILFIILTSVIFALTHDPSSIIYIAAMIILGIVLALCYQRSKVILYSMIIHGVNNILACVSTFITQNTNVTAVETATTATAMDYVIIIGCYLVFALSLFAFIRLTKKDKKIDNDYNVQIEMA